MGTSLAKSFRFMIHLVDIIKKNKNAQTPPGFVSTVKLHHPEITEMALGGLKSEEITLCKDLSISLQSHKNQIQWLYAMIEQWWYWHINITQNKQAYLEKY